MPTIEFHGDHICSGCGAILKPAPSSSEGDPEFNPHTNSECISLLRVRCRDLAHDIGDLERRGRNALDALSRLYRDLERDFIVLKKRRWWRP